MPISPGKESLGVKIARKVLSCHGKYHDIRFTPEQIEYLSEIELWMSFPEVRDICNNANIKSIGGFFNILKKASPRTQSKNAFPASPRTQSKNAFPASPRPRKLTPFLRTQSDKASPRPRKLTPFLRTQSMASPITSVEKEAFPRTSRLLLYVPKLILPESAELVTVPEEPFPEEPIPEGPIVTMCSKCKIAYTNPWMIYCRQCYETGLDKIYKKELGIIK